MKQSTTKHECLWMWVAITLIIVIILHMVWWHLYNQGNGMSSKHYKTTARIRSNIWTITQNQLEAATNVSQLLVAAINVPDLVSNKVSITIDDALNPREIFLDSGTGTETIVELPVDGAVMVLRLVDIAGKGKVLGIVIGAVKDITDITLADLQKFPKQISVSWETPKTSVQTVEYADFDMFGTIHQVPKYSFGQPTETDIAVIDMVLNTVPVEGG